MEKNFLEIGCRIHRMECRKKNPILYVFKLANLVKKEKYDIVHAHGNSATLAFDMLGAFFGKCKVRIAHSHNTKCGNDRLDKMLRPLFYRAYTHGMACGKMAGKWLFQERDYCILPNGRNLEDYKYDSSIRKQIQEQFDLKDFFVVGHVGRFNKQKNHKFLVEIFAEIKKIREDAELVLIGEGNLQNDIIQKVERMNLSKYVHFLGVRDDVNKIMQTFDALLFPSLFEGLGIVLIEAQAAGIPCFTSKDVVAKEAGITSLCHYISLDNTARQWAEYLLDNMDKKKDRYKEIEEAGYDLKTNTEWLEEFYVNAAKS